jgi:hypothetical protein
MPRQMLGQGGERVSAPFQTIFRPKGTAGNGQDIRCDGLYNGILWDYNWHEDFCGDLSATDLSNNGSIYDLSPAGSPTAGLVAGGAYGQLQCVLPNDNQQADVGYWWADQTQIPGDCRFFFQTRFQLTAIGANERVMFGLNSALAAHFTNWYDISQYARFVVDGSLGLRAQLKGGTATTTNTLTNRTLVASTWYVAEFEKKADGCCEFRLMNDRGLNLGTLAQIAAGDLDTTTMQPTFFAQKDSGSGQPGFIVDYMAAMAVRDGGA